MDLCLPGESGVVFPILDREERWRASTNSSSYQWALGRSNQGGCVPLCVRLCRHYRALVSVCCHRLPHSPPVSLILFGCPMTVCCDDQFTENHCSISGTNVNVTAAIHTNQYTQRTCFDICCHVSCSLARQVTNNHKFSHGIRTISPLSKRT